MQMDIKKIEDLISSGNYVEAKKLIEGAFSKQMEDSEKGALYTNLASLYLDVTNSIEDKYIESLKNTAELLERINESESQIDSKIQLANAKASLNM